MKSKPAGALLPNTPLPSGWAIEPMSGHCVRLSDGAQFGRTTSWAIAWSMRDIAELLPDATGLRLDLARLRNAVGCAVTGATFSTDEADNRRTAVAVHSVGEQLAGADEGPWRWTPAAPVSARFNTRLANLLDTVGVAGAQYPTSDGSGDESVLLAGCVGRIALRSTLRAAQADAPVARLEMEACDAGDASAALRRARTWAVAAARECLPHAAEAALAIVYRMPYHEDDVACAEIVRKAQGVLKRRAA